MTWAVVEVYYGGIEMYGLDGPPAPKVISTHGSKDEAQRICNQDQRNWGPGSSMGGSYTTVREVDTHTFYTLR